MKRKDRVLQQLNAQFSQSPAAPHDTSGQDNNCHVSGSVNVRGEIEVKVPVEVSNKQDATEEKKEARDKKRFGVEVAGLIFIIMYAVLTGFLVHYTSGQLKEARKVTGMTEQNFKRAEHAWVNVDFKSPVIRLGDTKTPPAYHFMIRNYGSSPALNIRASHILEMKNVAPRTLIYSTIEQRINAMSTLMDKTAFSLFNGQEVPVTRSITHSDGTPFPLTQEQIDDILQKRTFLVLYGKITYDDIFGDPHATSFCVSYNPKGWDGQEGWDACPIKQIAY